MPPNDAPLASPAERILARMEDLLSRVSPRDRAAIEKHLATCDAEPDRSHGTLWRRFAGLLGSLSPLPPRRCGTHSLQFFVPDGPYRKQVFALEDRHNGVLILYLPNILDVALQHHDIVHKDDKYLTPTTPPHPVSLTLIDSSNITGPRDHIEHMLGWNRKALRLVLRTGSSDAPDVTTAESLCRLAAAEWSKPIAR